MRKEDENTGMACKMTQAILESISDGVFTVDASWRVTSFNRAAELITGVDRQEALSRTCSDVFRSSLCGAACPLRKTLEGGRPIIGKTAYIIKADGERVPISISTALLKNAKGEVLGGAETFRDLSEVEALREELEGKSHVGELVSRSANMQRLFHVMPAIAESESTVVLYGETGTGKERFARTLHELSPRRKGPFWAINCGALPDNLLESELFGYKAGAFTGAAKDKPGKLALARGGTLFLDEVGELSPAFQVRLLRVLQERVYEPLGSVRSEKMDVRIMAATHRNLAQRVKEGLFREDLFYRLHVAHLELPPLRERMADLPLLVHQFIERFNRLQRRNVQDITVEAMNLLMAHPWPGNIRELENAIERAFILCGQGPLDVAHLGDNFHSVSLRSLNIDEKHLAGTAIQDALQKCHGDRTAAAQMLGIHKTTLYRRMKKLGLALPEGDGRNRHGA